MRKKTTQEFIESALSKHGDRYDYSLVEYKSTRIKVTIGCEIHGTFQQTPNDHRNGQGCPECGIAKRGIIRRSTNDEFIKKAKEKHGSKYDYSLVDYKKSTTKIAILCKEHGVFYQTPNDHNSGKGCLECGYLKMQSTQQEFINKAIYIHGDMYDYSLVDYKNSRKRVKIICSTHGVFEQQPRDHVNDANGCPKCRCSKGEKRIDKFLTSIGANFEREKKFKGCKLKRQLRFDFYINPLNLLIEYDGAYHFKEFNHFKNSSLSMIQASDKIKTEFANENGFNLLRIKYTDYEHIEAILTHALQTRITPEALAA